MVVDCTVNGDTFTLTSTSGVVSTFEVNSPHGVEWDFCRSNKYYCATEAVMQQLASVRGLINPALVANYFSYLQ